MELQQLSDLLKNYSPAHFRDICASLSLVSDELEYTKSALSKDLMDAQHQNDFYRAREILDIQEALLQRISDIRSILSYSEVAIKELDSSDDTEIGVDDTSLDERPDYSLYSMDDTVAYDIVDTPVTFKRPAAVSYKGKRYPVTKWRTLFVRICELLYKEDPSIIKSMINEPRRSGRKRVKMSYNKADIHSPVKIAGSDIWLETNRSASDIRKSILVLLDRYGIQSDSVKVYFRRDYAALHADDDQPEEI